MQSISALLVATIAGSSFGSSLKIKFKIKMEYCWLRMRQACQQISIDIV